ncbi:SLIT and NTRK-like protein 5 [Lethenteron reissneri]|uniref:SLIT and NTRK-like protein 5 n=1 Tax=Lethenteron reissneri TaxID=7753 RepID=UPI002AB63BCE|nr:SLIT and NTRK-like protein 5 [Lethenteron reissneri]
MDVRAIVLWTAVASCVLRRAGGAGAGLRQLDGPGLAGPDAEDTVGTESAVPTLGVAAAAVVQVDLCSSPCSCSEREGAWEVDCEARGLGPASALPPPPSAARSYRLYLARNPLGRLAPGDLVNHSGAVLAHLGSAEIDDIEDGAFVGWRSLKKLFLNGNNLESLRNDTLQGLDSLEYLQADYNLLSYLEAGAFANTPRLKVLILNDNLLSSLPAHCLRPLSLTHLDLRGNRVRTLAYGGLLEHLNRVLELQLDENPWNCSCDLLSMRRWLDNVPYSALLGDVTCETPFRLHGKQLRDVPRSELCQRRAASPSGGGGGSAASGGRLSRGNSHGGGGGGHNVHNQQQPNQHNNHHGHHGHHHHQQKTQQQGHGDRKGDGGGGDREERTMKKSKRPPDGGGGGNVTTESGGGGDGGGREVPKSSASFSSSLTSTTAPPVATTTSLATTTMATAAVATTTTVAPRASSTRHPKATVRNPRPSTRSTSHHHHHQQQHQHNQRPPIPVQCPTACACVVHTADLGLSVNCQERGIERLSSLRPRPGDPKKLYLTGNALGRVMRGDLEGLRALDLLHLAANRIAYVEEGSFDDLGGLRRLHLNGNDLARLTPGMLSGLGSLQYLYAEYNVLREVAPGTFERTPQLRLLFLNNNLLRWLPAGAFAATPELARLNLRGNHFRALPVAGVLDRISAPLVQVDLHENPWDCTCPLADLRRWMLEELSAGIVVGEVTCESPVRLAGRDVRSLPWEVLCPLPHDGDDGDDVAAAALIPAAPAITGRPQPAAVSPPSPVGEGAGRPLPPVAEAGTAGPGTPEVSAVPLSVLILSLLAVFVATVFAAAGLLVFVLRRRRLGQAVGGGGGGGGGAGGVGGGGAGRAVALKRKRGVSGRAGQDVGSAGLHLRYAIYGHGCSASSERGAKAAAERAMLTAASGAGVGTGAGVTGGVYDSSSVHLPRFLGRMCRNPIYAPPRAEWMSPSAVGANVGGIITGATATTATTTTTTTGAATAASLADISPGRLILSHLPGDGMVGHHHHQYHQYHHLLHHQQQQHHHHHPHQQQQLILDDHHFQHLQHLHERHHLLLQQQEHQQHQQHQQQQQEFLLEVEAGLRRQELKICEAITLAGVVELPQQQQQQLQMQQLQQMQQQAPRLLEAGCLLEASGGEYLELRAKVHADTDYLEVLERQATLHQA